MTESIPPLNWLRAFHVAARHNNLTRAAEEIGVTQTAISQHIKNLEGYLGVSLFKREARGVTLSEYGLAYLPTVKNAFESLSDGTIELFGEGSKKPLIIRSPVSFAHMRLLRLLSGFIEKHPGNLLRIETWNWQLDHDISDVDIDIRFGSGDWNGVDVTYLCSESWVPCCNPALLEKYGPLEDVSDLLNWPLVSIFGVSKGWKHWFRAVGLQDVSISPVLEVDTTSLAMQAALNGYAVCLCTPQNAKIDIEAGRLIQLFPQEIKSGEEAYILTAKGAMKRPRVMTFINWLKSEMS